MDMRYKKIEWAAFAADIIKAMENGILLTTKAGDKINTMTIGWGTLGRCWGLPVFQAFIREHRYTAEMLDKNPEFTVNIPLGSFDKKILGICGSHHGDEIDKIKEAGLTPVDSEIISVPGFKEFPVTLECRVLYRQLQDLGEYPQEIAEMYYPQDVDSSAYGANKDAHIMVIGEILNAYMYTE